MFLAGRADSRTGAGKIQDDFVMPGSKEVLKMMRICQRNMKASIKKLPLAKSGVTGAPK